MDEEDSKDEPGAGRDGSPAGRGRGRGRGKEGGGGARGITEAGTEGQRAAAAAAAERVQDGAGAEAGADVAGDETLDACTEKSRRGTLGLRSGRSLDVCVLERGQEVGRESGVGEEVKKQAHSPHWYDSMRRAHMSPHHWRHKFTGFLHAHSHELRHLLPHFPHQHRARDAAERAGRRGARWADLLTFAGLHGFYDGLEDLAHEDLVFVVDHPMRRWLLTFYNPTLERLYRKRNALHRLRHRVLGCGLLTGCCLVATAIDAPLLLRRAGAEAWPLLAGAGLGLVVQCACIAALLHLVRRAQTSTKLSPLEMAKGASHGRVLLLHDVLPCVHLLASTCILVLSARMLPEGACEAAACGRGYWMGEGRGLLAVHTLPRLVIFVLVVGIDGVWKLPSLLAGNALVLFLLAVYFAQQPWIWRQMEEGQAGTCEGEQAGREWRGALQDALPIVFTGLAVAYKRWLTDREERRQLCRFSSAPMC